MGLDPMPLDELLEQGPIEAARASIIDIFGAGLLAQFGVAQSRRTSYPDAMTPRDRAEARAIRVCRDCRPRRIRKGLAMPWRPRA